MKVYSVWVNWEKRVISFHQVPGFERKDYPTHEEMFAFAIEKGFEDFGIQ